MEACAFLQMKNRRKSLYLSRRVLEVGDHLSQEHTEDDQREFLDPDDLDLRMVVGRSCVEVRTGPW